MSLEDDLVLANQLVREELPSKTQKEARAALDRALQAAASLLWAVPHMANLLTATQLAWEELPPETQKKARAALDRVETAAHLLDAVPDMACLLSDLGSLFNPSGVPTHQKRRHSRTVDFRYVTQGSKKAYATLPRHIDIAVRMRELRGEKGAAGKVADEFNLKDETEVYRIMQDPTVMYFAWLVTAGGASDETDDLIPF